ncbi:MAG: right-handed parallel beta-helix repeat-containing protein [Euryarchaeota archaeon]|nr:right-handed parallel beta-helix repeat-containing protein [Euryarchaeota archaeon]
MSEKKIIRYIVIGLILISFGASVLPVGVSKQQGKNGYEQSSKVTWIVDDEGDGDFTSIQAAIDNASAGDTIEVYSGTYIETVIIEKSIELDGKDTEYSTGSDTGKPVVYGAGDDNVISVYTENQDAPVKISGFTITHSGSRHAGVYMEYSRSVVVSYNNITQNHHGVELYYSETDQIQENMIIDNDWALLIEFSTYCTVSMNHIVNNTHGIQMSVSNSNTITQNEIKDTQIDYGMLLIRSYVNQLTFNNFIDNDKQATFLNCLNYWHDNYWSNKVGISPVYVIFGIFQANIFPALRVPWPQFDLRAQTSPNPIP